MDRNTPDPGGFNANRVINLVRNRESTRIFTVYMTMRPHTYETPGMIIGRDSIAYLRSSRKLCETMREKSQNFVEIRIDIPR